MAERANAVSGTVQTGTSATQDKPASTQEKPAATQEKPGSSQAKPAAPQPTSTGLPTTGDFQITPTQPWVAETGSGYKLYPGGSVHLDPGIVDGIYGPSGARYTLTGPDGTPIGYYRSEVGWIRPDGHGLAKELSGIKPDPTWQTNEGLTPTKVAPPSLPTDENAFTPETYKGDLM